MKTEDKIRALLPLVPESTKAFLDDMYKRGLTFGSFTPKQAKYIDDLFDRIRRGVSVQTTKQEPQTKTHQKDANCLDCGDSGNLFVERHVEPHKGSTGVFRCHCEVGSSRHPNQGAQWDDSYLCEYAKKPMFQ